MNGFMLVNKGQREIFDDKFLVEQKKKDPAFYYREYEGKYGYGLGNVFLPTEIEQCCYEHVIPQVNYSSSISMGIDPGFGSSKFGTTIVQLEDNILKVLDAKESNRLSYENMIMFVTQLRYQYKPNKSYLGPLDTRMVFIETITLQRVARRAS
jgi:hypothetical protein